MGCPSYSYQDCPVVRVAALALALFKEALDVVGVAGDSDSQGGGSTDGGDDASEKHSWLHDGWRRGR